MSYKPRFTISPEILRRLETIQLLHTRIQDAAMKLPALALLQKEVVVRSAHGTSAIEGNRLTLEEARRTLDGKDVPTATRRSIKEIQNASAAIRYVQRHGDAKLIKETDVFKIHSLLGTGDALDRGPIGDYRNYGVRVGNHIAPHASDVPHYMRELLDWLNNDASQWPAVVSTAILHFRFEFIHPFGDGNGRTGRILSAWELYRRKFDSQHIFAMDETLWDNRPKYYAALDQAQKSKKQDLSHWIEFMTEMLELTLERTWGRIEEMKSEKHSERMYLTPRQEKLLKLLRAGPLRPAELQRELGLTKGGLHYVLKLLIHGGLVERQGGYKTGVYRTP